jgi:serine protein kinase
MTNHLDNALGLFNKDQFKKLHEEMSFNEYYELMFTNPKLCRTAPQMCFDMIMEKGSYKYEKYRKLLTHYNFFDDVELPIIGIEETKDELVKFIKGAAGGFGTERRILLLHGPVGSSKSTICRLIKRGLEKYSKTDAGAWYTFKWVNLPIGEDGVYVNHEDEAPLNDNPLKLLPVEIRDKTLVELNEVFRNQEKDLERLYTLTCEGDLDPRSKLFMNYFMNKYEGDLQKILTDHIRVVRKVYSEVDRVGIGTFQPKDEKNQDSTELNGDINFQRIARFGSDSDPRAFDFKGEFTIANRGVLEFIEILKLDIAFLYDLLGATQEKSIKPKKFSQITIDELIIGHTNSQEYVKLKANNCMEALRDRTVKIDVPYNLNWSDEIKILEKDYGSHKVKQHIAPHTLEIAALWAILTRLHDDRSSKIDLIDKAELYNGKLLPSWSEEAVKELRDQGIDNAEGMIGVSSRYIQDKISNCLSNNHVYVNPFMVINELKQGLDSSSLFNNQELIEKYRVCIDLAMNKLTEILKNEVQLAVVGDKEAIVRLCANYIDNIMAYINRSKVKNPYTGQEQEPNEKLMRSIEEKIGIPAPGAPDFRRMIAAFIGDLAHKKKEFTWDSNHQLRQALEMKLFEDTKDHIKISALNVAGTTVVDKDLQEKIDAIKYRLINNCGYNEQSATDVLEYVSGIFASGDSKTN